MNPLIAAGVPIVHRRSKGPEPEGARRECLRSRPSIRADRTASDAVPKRAVIEDNTNSSASSSSTRKTRPASEWCSSPPGRTSRKHQDPDGIKEGERVATSNLADLRRRGGDPGRWCGTGRRDRRAVLTGNGRNRRRARSRGNVMQKLAEVCVRRPVFASMLIAAIVVVGGSATKLGVDRYPRIETPVVSVTTSNPGATPRASRRRSPTASRPRSTPSPASTSCGRRRPKASRASPSRSTSRRTPTSPRRRSGPRSTRHPQPARDRRSAGRRSRTPTRCRS